MRTDAYRCIQMHTGAYRRKHTSSSAFFFASSFSALLPFRPRLRLTQLRRCLLLQRAIMHVYACRHTMKRSPHGFLLLMIVLLLRWRLESLRCFPDRPSLPVGAASQSPSVLLQAYTCIHMHTYAHLVCFLFSFCFVDACPWGWGAGRLDLLLELHGNHHQYCYKHNHRRSKHRNSHSNNHRTSTAGSTRKTDDSPVGPLAHPGP